ncbi:helix-hairpin-helix domain-containing protein [Desulforhopalus vacuolatus]|uniref:ComEA family DNA-binding protein n=1 Tax=Desulforhopalus vacuolatus TaxID=40414 RepID=UPI001965FA94|nr:helix-hairpin-helix domain-containing protein [Desulforhopalus vacuolatus]MBM9519623.1 helix-hairpin-helix domain-containing protein [Desulforhopalus vacuolatus]
MECTPSPQGIQEKPESETGSIPDEKLFWEKENHWLVLMLLCFALLFIGWFRLSDSFDNPQKIIIDDSLRKNRAINIILFGKISINSATEEELCLVKGVGEKRARAILAWRRKHGRIDGPQFLSEIKGIGPVGAKNIAEKFRFD